MNKPHNAYNIEQLLNRLICFLFKKEEGILCKVFKHVLAKLVRKCNLQVYSFNEVTRQKSLTTSSTNLLLDDI